MTDESVDRWTLRPPSQDNTAPEGQHNTLLTPEPHEDLPSQEPETVYDMVKRAFVDAFTEIKPLMRDMITEAIQASQSIDEAEQEPEIPYKERLHRAKLALNLAIPAIVILILSVLFAGVSGQSLTAGIGIVMVWAVVIASYVIVSRQSKKLTTKRAKALRRTIMLGWTIGAIVVIFLFCVGLSVAGVNLILAFAYSGLSVIVMYFAARESYKWSALWIYRSGAQLIADRPASNIFFMKPLHKILMLHKVDNCDITTPNWLENRLGMDRIMIDVPGNEDAYWNTLTFIVNGDQLLRAVNQGSEEARR